MKSIFTFLAILISGSFIAQDTFSMVALDPLTGEVGSAGASCVDLFQTSLSTDHFLGELFPGLGAINTQAWYHPANQDNAADRMLDGDTPQEIIDWLVANDVQTNPGLRQYGIVGYENGIPTSAGYTGDETDDYKNHIAGPSYCIQGNILLGQAVLDSMEARFIAEEGDLACKLMAALQGANMIGADTRCGENGTSSLFAFIQVAQTTDDNLDPSFLVSVRTHDGDGIEPIDSLQTKFNLVHNCGPMDIREFEEGELAFSFFPNPAEDFLTIQNKVDPTAQNQVEIYSLTGSLVLKSSFVQSTRLDVSELAPGAYELVIYNKDDHLVTILCRE